MSSYVVTPLRAEARPSRLYLSFAMIVAAALLAVAVPSLRSQVTVAGEEHLISQGTAVADLIDAELIGAVPGDLLDIEQELLTEGGGTDPVFFVNGRRAEPRTMLFDGDRVSSRRGGDVVEPTESTRTTIPIPIENVGSGPLISLESPGSVGVLETVAGAISGKVVSVREIEPAQAMVVRRWVPDPGSRVVALTFDDGPWPGQTDRILDILAEHDVRASFFMVGYMVQRHPQLARRVAAEEHVVANHTSGHVVLTRQGGDTVREQIRGGSDILRATTGVESAWFRPPGGGLSPAVFSEADAIGQKVVMWDVDPQDWRRPGAEEIRDRVLANVKPGSVVLLHDGGGDRSQTVEMLPDLIEQLKELDYIFVTLDELRK